MTPKSYPENGAQRDWLPPYMIFLLCVTSFLVIFRITLRATGRSSSLGLDDAFLVPSWIFQIAFASIAIFSARAGIIDRHFSEFRIVDTHTFEATALASEIIFIVGTCCLKISVLLFFRRMVKGLLEPKWRYLIWAAIAFTIGYTLAFFIILTMSLNCFDFMAIKALGATPQNRPQLCVAAPQICIAAGVLSIISDCYAIFLPWVITRRLCLPVRRRVAMNALFASSALIVIAACVRTANLIKVHRLDDPTWNGMNANAAAMAEWSFGLILACLPTLRSVWRLSRNRSRTGSQSQRGLLSAHDLPRWSWGVGTFATRLRPNREVKPEIVPCSILERPKEVYQGGRGLDEEKLDAWMALRNLLPSIARDLNAQSSITWAGTSALIANTVFQVLYGRLSDLFGRKKIMLSALVLLALCDLACGLSVNSTMLYVFRGLVGVANGGITSLSMMIVSDIVTLQERGRYQGILGVMVGMGNALGPLIASAFAIHLTWRALFYLLSPFTMIVAGASYVYLPSNMPKVNLMDTIRKIDFLGLITGSLFIILVLIAISQGGHPGTPWDSALVISMLTVGGVLGVIFLVVEWRATLPMMPLDMFRRPSVAAMLAQSFLFGASYFAYLFYLPLYFQNVKGLSPLMSAVVFLALVIPQSASSIVAGFYMSKFNRYIEVVWWGFGIWSVGSGLMIMCDENTHLGLVAFFLILTGCGTGSIFQPTLVALQAHCPKEQRAVVTSNRNTLRSLGAAVSIAASGALLANTLRSSLPDELQYLAADSFAAPDLSSFSPEQRKQISKAYASASRAVFIWCFVLIAVSLALTTIIRDSGLSRKTEEAAQKQEDNAEETRLEEGNVDSKER